MSIEEKVAHLDEKVTTLFKAQAELHELAESTHKIAIAVEKLTTKMDSHERRIGILESERQYKLRTVWTSVVSGILGAAVAAVCAIIFG